MISLSYDAIISTDITTPIEQYMIKDIHEMFTKYRFKLYAPITDNLIRWRLSGRKNLPNFEDYLYKGGIYVNLIGFQILMKYIFMGLF